MSEPLPTSKLPLFVFGTLRLGHRNHHYLENRFIRMMPGLLNGYERLHELMIAPKADGTVDGELFFLSREIYDETLAGCDELEEIPPGQLIGHEYERKVVSVETSEGTYQAWAYVQPESRPD